MYTNDFICAIMVIVWFEMFTVLITSNRYSTKNYLQRAKGLIAIMWLLDYNTCFLKVCLFVCVCTLCYDGNKKWIDLKCLLTMIPQNPSTLIHISTAANDLNHPISLLWIRQTSTTMTGGCDEITCHLLTPWAPLCSGTTAAMKRRGGWGVVHL